MVPHLSLSLVFWKGEDLKIVGYLNLSPEPLLNEALGRKMGRHPVCASCVRLSVYLSFLSVLFFSLSLFSSFPLNHCVGRWVGADVHIHGRHCPSHLICATSLSSSSSSLEIACKLSNCPKLLWHCTSLNSIHQPHKIQSALLHFQAASPHFSANDSRATAKLERSINF